MNPELELLVDLSDTDDAYLKAHRALLDAQGAVGAAEQALAKAKAARDGVKAEHDAAKAIERDANKRLEQYKVQLGRAIKVLETGVGDANAAERQQAQCLAIIDDIETELLEAFEVIEAIDERLAAAQRVVADSEASLAATRAKAEGAIAAAQEKVDGLLARRKPLHDALHPELQRRYDQLRRKKPPPVARIHEGACRSCRVTIPPQMLADLQGSLMPPCRGCGRWLVPAD